MTIVLVAGFIGLGLTLGSPFLIGPAGSENELCWSCGLRNQHKLWCPNR